MTGPEGHRHFDRVDMKSTPTNGLQRFSVDVPVRVSARRAAVALRYGHLWYRCGPMTPATADAGRPDDNDTHDKQPRRGGHMVLPDG
jgi:hypothetical protein